MFKYLFPISILASTIIGAGMFSLPFVFSRAGFAVGILYLIIFTIVLWLTHTMYADIILRTDHKPRFVTYARVYLGNWTAPLAALASVFAVMLAATAYIALSESFTKLIFPDVPGFYAATLFWFSGSLLIAGNIKNLALGEFLIAAAMIIIVALVFFYAVYTNGSAFGNIVFAPVSLSAIFLPFGPILFSLSGRGAIPSVLKEMKESRVSEKYAGKIIWLGTLIPALLYLFFIVGIFLLSPQISEDAVAGISGAPNVLVFFLGILGLIAVFSTYVPLSISIKDILVFDFKIPVIVATLITIVIPFLVYLWGANNFLALISISGGIFLAMESILIALIWRKLNVLRKPRMLLTNFENSAAYFIIIVFLGGMGYELIKLMANG